MSASSSGGSRGLARAVQGVRDFGLLRLAVHLGALLPAVLILVAALTGGLTANPVQALEQRTGKAALILLVAALACSPANLLFGWRQLLRHRRTLGLYAFAYAATHFLILVGLDYGFALGLLIEDLSGKPFIWLGLAAALILSALAVTSFGGWKKRLGINWKRLHRLAYLALALAIVHYAWARKGNLTTLSGDILQPIAFGGVASVLLLMRFPVVKRWIARRRGDGVGARAGVAG